MTRKQPRLWRLTGMCGFLALAIGCGKPPAPPKGAETETASPDIELGGPSDTPAGKASPAEKTAPAASDSSSAPSSATDSDTPAEAEPAGKNPTP